MNQVIEEAFVKLHNNISSLVGILDANLWLFDVQNILLQLQQENLGRITSKQNKNPSKSKFINYLSIKDWIMKLRINSIEEGICCKKDILSHIFGLRHALGDGMLQKKDSGVVDSIVLGVIPQKLHNCVINSCKNAVYSDVYLDDRPGKFNELKRLWKEIVKLIRINIIGVHRICSDITKEYKSNWMKTFNIESEKKIKIREDKLRNAESSSDSDSESEIESANVHIKEEKIPTPSNTDNIHKDNHDIRFCMGIKCKYLGSVWHGNKNGNGKRIKTKQKNCQSCSKLRIALQKCV